MIGQYHLRGCSSGLQRFCKIPRGIGQGVQGMLCYRLRNNNNNAFDALVMRLLFVDGGHTAILRP